MESRIVSPVCPSSVRAATRPAAIRLICAVLLLPLLAASNANSASVLNDSHVILAIADEQFVVVQDGYKGVTGTSARSVSWWYRGTLAGPAQSMIDWGATGTSQRWSIQFEGSENRRIALEGSAAKIGWNGNSNSPMQNLANGQWHHLAMTAPAGGTFSDVEFYLDGSQLVASTIGGNPSAAYNTAAIIDFRAGARGADTPIYLEGSLDELALWDVELAPAAIGEIYNGGAPTDLNQNGSAYSSAGALQLYWRFEEGSGLTTAKSRGYQKSRGLSPESLESLNFPRSPTKTASIRTSRRGLLFVTRMDTGWMT